MFSRLWNNFAYFREPVYKKNRYNIKKKKNQSNVVEARIIPLIVETFTVITVNWHSIRNDCKKQSFPKCYISAKYTRFAYQNSATLAASSTIDIQYGRGVNSPTLCRAVLLVPWSATPLLGSSHCLCQKPLEVEPCQTVNLEVHALLVGNAERQLFKLKTLIMMCSSPSLYRQSVSPVATQRKLQHFSWFPPLSWANGSAHWLASSPKGVYKILHRFIFFVC